jgi:lysophospholipase L1-like esterase
MRVLERTHLFRIGTIVAALLSVTVALMVVRASAAHADGYTYVAVGDSYSSGEGGGAYYDGACDQSPFSYPSEFMQQDVDYYGSGWIAACSGATSGDVELQLGALGSDTRLVTVTAGGDDLGFGSTMASCAGIPQDCTGLALTSSQLATVQTRLMLLFANIRQKAPNAHLYVLGYPDLFPSGSSTCQNAGIAASAVAQFHTALQQVNAMIQAAVASVGAEYLDTTSAFAGHDICSSNSYGNGVMDALAQQHIAAAFHPNAAGYQVMTRIVYNQAVNVDHIFSPPPSGGGGGGGNPSPSSGPGGPGGPGPDPSPSVSSTWWPN